MFLDDLEDIMPWWQAKRFPQKSTLPVTDCSGTACHCDQWSPIGSATQLLIGCLSTRTIFEVRSSTADFKYGSTGPVCFQELVSRSSLRLDVGCIMCHNCQLSMCSDLTKAIRIMPVLYAPLMSSLLAVQEKKEKVNMSLAAFFKNKWSSRVHHPSQVLFRVRR